MLTPPTERGPRSTNSTFVVLKNTAKLKPSSKWTAYWWKEKPSHFLWRFDVQISKNTTASQRNTSFLKHWIYTFHWWWLQAYSCWLRWWLDVWFWNNWWGEEWNCIREWWQHCNVNCRNVSIFIGFFFSVPPWLCSPLPQDYLGQGSSWLRITWYEKG